MVYVTVNMAALASEYEDAVPNPIFGPDALTDENFPRGPVVDVVEEASGSPGDLHILTVRSPCHLHDLYRLRPCDHNPAFCYPVCVRPKVYFHYRHYHPSVATCRKTRTTSFFFFSVALEDMN